MRYMRIKTGVVLSAFLSVSSCGINRGEVTDVSQMVGWTNQDTEGNFPALNETVIKTDTDTDKNEPSDTSTESSDTAIPDTTADETCPEAPEDASRYTTAKSDGTVIAETDFEKGADEARYTRRSWRADGFRPPWEQGFNKGRAHIDTDQAYSGKRSLRIDYPAHTYLPHANGVQAPLKFTPLKEVFISYRFKFSENFDWGGENEGGKLPGLASGKNCSGGRTCDGKNGFSARLMWRAGGKAVLYLYHMDKPGSFGEDMDLVTCGTLVYFQPGRWHQVIERVKINTGNNNDGEIQVWIDGKEALSRTNIRFVNDGSLVDNLYFSTFHGGSDASWAPSEDCFIWYDNVRIYY